MVHTSALLGTTEWHIGIEDIDAVDPDGPGPEPVDSLQATVYIFGEDGSSEAVERVVGLVDNILLIFKFDDNTDGAEDFLLNDLHLRLGLGENRGLNMSDK